MKAITLFIGAALALGLAACGGDDTPPAPTDNTTVVVIENTNGPCGDGTFPKGNEVCK
jgi:ABC-type glycerol-3-phosphate transport system substrate-binding protein